MPKLRNPKYHLAEVRKEAFPCPALLISDGRQWWQPLSLHTDSKEKAAFGHWGHTFRIISTAFSTCYPHRALSSTSLISRGCFARRNFISFVLLTLFWEADSGSNATPQCQALNCWLQLLTQARRVCMSLSNGLCPLVRDGKLPLVSGSFQFPAPVPKLSGPFSSTSAGQTFIS